MMAKKSRRQYHVSRLNALWHIDGHHKLSNGHGYEKPSRFAGMGQVGAGVGGYIYTHTKPEVFPMTHQICSESAQNFYDPKWQG